MHLPVSHQGHLGDFEDENEDLHARLQDSGGSAGEGSPGSRGSGGCIQDRPVKVIPCPRCQSMNTKFCYYNNYSVNQPRHFCRNCQRYWTVGGTLRNVPVGGGSRKKTRSRGSRNEPYLRNGADATSPTGSLSSPVHQQVLQSVSNLQHLSSMLPQSQVGALGFGGIQLGGFPSSISQIPFLQFALEQNQGGGYPQVVSKALESHQDATAADLQSLYETQSPNSGLLSHSSAMMNGGYYVPDVEQSHSEALGSVMQKAGLWATQPQLQSLAGVTTQSQPTWIEERQSKPSLLSQLQAQGGLEERRNQLNAAVLHHKPGFWETALMHSRPVMSKRPPHGALPSWDERQSTPQQQQQANLSPHGSSTIEEEGSTPSNGYSHGYEDASSWGGLNASDIYFH